MTIRKAAATDKGVRVFIALLLIIFAQWLISRTASAQGTLPVACSEVEGKRVGDVESLIAAIELANQTKDPTNPAFIKLGENCTYEFSQPYKGSSNALPQLTSPMRIEGNGSVLQRARNTPRFRLIQAVGPTQVVLADLSLIRGESRVRERGGAILTQNDVALQIDNVLFQGNRADSGGAIAADSPTTIRRSTFTQNVALADVGGAIHATSGLIIEQSRFRQNFAQKGWGRGGSCWSRPPYHTYNR